MSDKRSKLERERRWLLPAGIASVAGVALILATFGESAAAIRASEGLADSLRDVHADPGPLVIASLVQALGWILLAVPLVVLFRAASARSTRMRTGLIGVVIVGPLFLAVGSVLGALSVTEAADNFTQDGPAAIERCVERKSEANQGSADQGQGNRGQGNANQGQGNQQGGAADGDQAADPDVVAECEDQVARDERTSTSVAGIETGFGLAGLLGFTIAVVYTALWTLRTGLLTRFWGSLGIALGAVFSFFTLFTLAWFIYVGLLLAGWVPGGRPPAWAAGEARPWPKGGPLFGGGKGSDEPDETVIEGEAEELSPDHDQAPEVPELPEPADHGKAAEPPRKRKKRDS